MAFPLFLSRIFLLIKTAACLQSVSHSGRLAAILRLCQPARTITKKYPFEPRDKRWRYSST
jgi:hypothetical protein